MRMDYQKLLAENEKLRIRLEEAEEMISAIRSGEVDALVVSSGEGEKIFTLEGADQPYRVLVETMSEGAATLSPDSTVLYCNSRLAEMLRMPLEGILGTPFLSHIAPGDASVFMALLERSLAENCRMGESFRAEFNLLTEGGKSVPALMSCCPLGLAGNRGISIIVTDLSEQKRNEEIVAAGELASSILEQAGEPIIVCDQNGRVIRASRQSHELFGINLMFRPFEQLGLLRESSSGQPFSISAPLNGKVLQGVEVMFQRNDRQFYLLLNARPLLRRQEILGCVVTLTDITERKEAEEALRSAKKAAEEASRAKDTFLVNMSHELRTPLTVNMGMLELAKISGDCKETTLQYLDHASSSADSLLQLIENILELRSLQDKSLHLAEEPFDLVECCRDVLSQLIPPAEEKGLECTIHFGSRLPRRVIGDCGKVQEVLSHLIGNAVKFTEQGRIEISVRPEGRGVDGREKIHFEIRDTGIGIPADKLHVMFQPFSQADPSLTRRYGGAGLGLAISRGLIEQLGGKIEVQSGPGEGSVFSFMLPFKVAAEESKPAPAAHRPPTERTPTAPSTRILVVEDDPRIAGLLREILIQGGYRVILAEHGRKALEVLEEEPIDLILMDLKMPVMDGYEATRSIRQREQWRGMPIIALTAHARPEEKAKCLAMGMDDFLTKPVDMQKLYTMIDRHLSSSNFADT